MKTSRLTKEKKILLAVLAGILALGAVIVRLLFYFGFLSWRQLGAFFS